MSSRRDPPRPVTPRPGSGVGRVRASTMPVVAVVGRPNVGKSTLTNRLIGRREAIVEERPGVTRDRISHEVHWRGRTLRVVDTGGWMPTFTRRRGELDEAVADQAELAAAEADLVLLVVDATVGVTEEDAATARWLRTSGVPLLLVANKVDAPGPQAALTVDLDPLYRLGVGEPLAVSALHGRGSGDLLDRIVQQVERNADTARLPHDEGAGEVAVALVGRPNVGKSSLYNRLLGEQRVVVDPRPGTTRDAVDTVVDLDDGRSYRFVDTAGLRRRLKREPTTEFFASVRTRRALERADVALLLADAAEPLGDAEQRLATEVVDAGRGLVVVLNKWDLVDEDRRDELGREVEVQLGHVGWAPLVRVSAQTGRGLRRLLDAVDRSVAAWRERVPTAALNDWLAEAVADAAPPMHRGRPVRLRYATQAGSAPPTIRIFGSGRVPPSYERYLERRLRERFGFEGSPIDLAVRVRARWEERT